MTQSWPKCHRELRVLVDRRWGPPELLKDTTDLLAPGLPCLLKSSFFLWLFFR